MTPNQKAERLAQCRASYSETERRIEGLEARRRSSIEADDDSSAAECDCELVKNWQLLKRLSDKARWTEAVTATAIPEDAAGLRSEIAECEQRLVRLSSLRRLDLSATQDEAKQVLPSHISFLKSRLALAERMAR
jgi:hypothetical protein